MNSVSPECLPRSCTYRGKRKRRALDNQDSPLFGYATSSEVLYAPKNNCQSVTCPTNSTCVELFPPVCRCSDHSFYFQDVCIPYTNDFMFRLKHLHFDVPWMEKYHDEQSLEFQYLKRRTEERLFHLLSQVLNTPSLLSVKVEPTGKNQVVVSEGHWLIDQRNGNTLVELIENMTLIDILMRKSTWALSRLKLWGVGQFFSSHFNSFAPLNLLKFWKFSTPPNYCHPLI